MPDILPSEVETLILDAAGKLGFDLTGGRVRRTSSRFCLGVEHGDYNGTDLFGVGTDRFIWVAYKPNNTPNARLFSANFPDDGLIEFPVASPPPPGSTAESWARFPYGVCHTLRREGYDLQTGLDAIVYGNIPGGGMSRSASLAINLVLGFSEASGLEVPQGMRVVDLAKAVENDYIGSPCGNLDQIMIYFAKAGMGTHYSPGDGSIKHVPLASDAQPFRLVSLDTGTNRPGLEKSTYKVRRSECEELVDLCRDQFGINTLGDVKSNEQLDAIRQAHSDKLHLLARLKYIYEAQQRFEKMLQAWREGDVATVGSIFRQDGYGLRDDYQISGPELEAMCDIARTCNGVLGERMLGGGDKGASGAIVLPDAVQTLKDAVAQQYPSRCPDFADKYSVHACSLVDGVCDAPL